MKSKSTSTSTLLLLLQCLVLFSGTAAAKARARQGDYLDRLRRSPSWEADTMAVSASNSAPLRRHADTAPVVPKEADRVTSLPGQPHEGVDFAQYAGYVTVEAGKGRALFYYLAEAVGGNSASKPLLLWLNGGPGCSSFGYGAMEELGPFRVMSDGKTLYRNPYSWNHVANVLFLESPAGVGYSYSNTTSDYGRSGDNQTAEDAHAFLMNWMERFPEYKGRDFYVAGESYAGHYVPQLAHAILSSHGAAGKSSPINLKGIMIGNAVINDGTDTKGMYDFFWTHALISDETMEGINGHCNFTDAAKSSPLCEQATDQADANLEDIDIYNIYAPMCNSSGLTPHPIPYSMEKFDPCTDNYVEAYLNDPKVQEALHANVTRLNHPWSPCSEILTHWIDSPSTVLPIIRELSSNGIRVWVYSGDIDGRVPVTSSRYSVNLLKLPVAASWRRWFISTQGVAEVGGYIVQYKGNLSLVTVRGAGHEVPSYQPQRALVLVQYFLTGKPLPKQGVLNHRKW